jgi:hypothetical protein
MCSAQAVSEISCPPLVRGEVAARRRRRVGCNAGIAHSESVNRGSCYGSSTESLLDPLQHAGYVGEYFTIPKSNYLVTTLLDQLCAEVILCGAVEVLGAVELDYQSRLWASEVRDEVADRELSPETKIRKSSGSKTRPEFLFGIGLVVTQLATAMVG